MSTHYQGVLYQLFHEKQFQRVLDLFALKNRRENFFFFLFALLQSF